MSAAQAKGALKTPKGMGDVLPPEAKRRRALTRVVLETFELSGYELVTTPLFEHAAVVERGESTLDPRDMLRFVEPESGEVAVLRPDITPQIARVVATRMSKLPPPWRLCYEGRVVRRRRGRARSHQQITQAGVEYIGVLGLEADTEVVMLAHRACLAAGLRDFRIELSQVNIAGALLQQVPDDARAEVADALARKDASALRAALRGERLPKALASRLQALLPCYGGLDVLAGAARELRWAEARAGLANLRAIVDRLSRLGIAPRLAIDLSDARGLRYYTGVSFSVLADGPGEPIGAGGRYDRLLRRFGMDQPATGFAFDLENLQWALRKAGRRTAPTEPLRLVLAGAGADAREALASALRDKRTVVATLPTYADARACLAFARAWSYDMVVVLARRGARALRASDAAQEQLTVVDPASILALAKWARATTKG